MSLLEHVSIPLGPRPLCEAGTCARRATHAAIRAADTDWAVRMQFRGFWFLCSSHVGGQRQLADNSDVTYVRLDTTTAARVQRGPGQLMRLQNLNRKAPTGRGVRQVYRVVEATSCVRCGWMVYGEELVTRGNRNHGVLCTECNPILCSVRDLALNEPTPTDPMRWAARPAVAVA